jgi:hypothetical protein
LASVNAFWEKVRGPVDAALEQERPQGPLPDSETLLMRVRLGKPDERHHWLPPVVGLGAVAAAATILFVLSAPGHFDTSIGDEGFAAAVTRSVSRLELPVGEGIEGGGAASYSPTLKGIDVTLDRWVERSSEWQF